jgi:hypothetical protein
MLSFHGCMANPAKIDARVMHAVCRIGNRPTVSGKSSLVGVNGYVHWEHSALMAWRLRDTTSGSFGAFLLPRYSLYGRQGQGLSASLHVDGERSLVLCW